MEAVWLTGICAPALAQTASQIVPWSIELRPAATLRSGEKATAHLSATIKTGWHVYALSQGPGGPTPLTLKLQDAPAFELSGLPKAATPLSLYDKNFEMETQFYEHSIEIDLPVAVKPAAPEGHQEATLDVHFQTCNETTCLPPSTAHLTFEATIASGTASAAAGIATTRPPPTTPAQAAPGKAAIVSSTSPGVLKHATTVEPVAAPGPVPETTASIAPPSVKPAVSTPAPLSVTAQGFGSFLWLAFGMGALSLLTPCVFPMIPITVSYFAGHAAAKRSSAIAMAAVYAGGIILTFSAVGMLLAILFGAGGVNRLAANPWVNLFITAVFLGFALSLFGAFFLQLPVSLTQRLDSLSRSKETTGTLGALLMGILFTLTSFTCTAPFVGTLLVMATQGNWRWPLAGMLAFSSVFALPFFVLALAPQLLSTLPRAGGWMNSVKVVMGFLEIAAAMKFLANADMVFGWGIFTRQAVLSIWVAVGLLIVIYVLGFYRMSHDSSVEVVTAPRAVFAIVFLAISVWLTTGLLGHSMGELEAFLPPPPDTTNAATGVAVTGPQWILNDLASAKSQAAKEHKPIFIDFTGYTCTNCRWMEANMFSRPEIQAAMSHFVLVRLYTDGDGKLDEDQEAMQNREFGTVALPLYALLQPDGTQIATFPGLTRDPNQFLTFLHRAPIS
jgi:thiol:disulfide interchange protein